MSPKRRPEAPTPGTPAPANDGPEQATTALYGVGEGHELPGMVWLPDAQPANDGPHDADDARLARDPAFAAVCDARREAWIDSMERNADAEEQDDDRT